MATKREQLEKLVHDMKAFADECDAKDGGPTADDLNRLNQYGTDVNALIESIKSSAAASGTLDVAKSFLGDLAGEATTAPAAKSALDEQFAAAGLVNPSGMTVGEAFVKSPAFTDFVKHNVGSDGSIRMTRGIKSAGYELPGFGAKDVLTGASSTSACLLYTSDAADE